MLISTKADLKCELAHYRAAGADVGLVPTMGALHEGHLALIHAARAKNSCVVVSIFVNPTQFAAGEDFERYPRDVQADVALAHEAGAELIFAPSVDEMYGNPFSSLAIDPGPLAHVWEGASRPKHFNGVALVVTKLLNLVCPTSAYFGEKDYQQYRVICDLVKALDISTQIVAVPTVRDADGLALSSRNRYLSDEQRRQATALARALARAQDFYRDGVRDARALTADLTAYLRTEAPCLQQEYSAAVNAITLERQTTLTDNSRIILAVLAGKTRLIDNAGICA